MNNFIDVKHPILPPLGSYDNPYVLYHHQAIRLYPNYITGIPFKMGGAFYVGSGNINS